ncbi:hypothetical protein GE09DRAFT_543580 [Coniochaeta sp. 2T2.1]|nr:hypothetical protein GE09DRAFT_543580 [Coniochaeta sp. 2T2.1]
MHGGRVPFSAIALSALATLSSARDLGMQWKPARQTGLPNRGDDGGGGLYVDVGFSPAPTEVPRRPSELAGMELFKRYQMGTDTCGFAAEFKSSPWTCFRVGAKCATTGSHMGCCVDDFPKCQSSFLTTCLDLATAPSSCGTGSLCCSSTKSPSCFTWLFSSSTDPGATYSLLNCYASGGIGTLLDAPPTVTTSDSSSTSSSSSSSSSSSRSSTSTTSSTSPPTPTETDSPSPTPVGAIVGGVVGGVAILGIAAVAIFYLLVRHRRQNDAKTPGVGAAAPGGALSPGGGGMYYAQGASPTSPPGGGQAYYDPSKDVHAAGQQMYPAYGQPGWVPSQVPTAQTSYGVGHQQGWSPQLQTPLQHQSPPISELGGTNHALGTQAHRAELEQ